jgi:hypothetical protein
VTLPQQSAVRQTLRKAVRNTVLPGSQANMRTPVESLLRDLALVLHATAAVRQVMEAEQAACAAAS